MDKKQTTGRRVRHHRENSVLVGIFLLIVGSALMMRQLDVALPDWLFTWPMIPILAGLLIGLHSGFRDVGWLIIFLVGVFFLTDEIWPKFSFKPYLIPGGIILVGLFLLFRGRIFRDGRYRPGVRVKYGVGEETDAGAVAAQSKPVGDHTDEIIDIVSIFSNVKKHVFSKNFLGGEVVAIFGGAEVNLMQADFNGIVEIECVQIFGGTTLYIPPTWEVRSETAAIFGGIEDKRKEVTPGEPERILVLDGFTLFGGIEIKTRY